jgi:hypothetical protein
MTWRGTLVVAALAAVVPAEVGATASIKVAAVDRSHPGVVRIAVRWHGGRSPSFRLSPACGLAESGDWVIASTVTVAARRQAVLELPDDLAWLGDPRLPCRTHALTVQMLEGSAVVAGAEVPIDIPAPRAFTAAPPPPLDPVAPRFGFVGRKLQAPQTKMSEAGVTWSVNKHVTLNLSYERTGYAPVMSRDHDDGILTGVKVGF